MECDLEHRYLCRTSCFSPTSEPTISDVSENAPNQTLIPLEIYLATISGLAAIMLILGSSYLKTRNETRYIREELARMDELFESQRLAALSRLPE